MHAPGSIPRASFFTVQGIKNEAVTLKHNILGKCLLGNPECLRFGCNVYTEPAVQTFIESVNVNPVFRKPCSTYRIPKPCNPTIIRLFRIFLF